MSKYNLHKLRLSLNITELFPTRKSDNITTWLKNRFLPGNAQQLFTLLYVKLLPPSDYQLVFRIRIHLLIKQTEYLTADTIYHGPGNKRIHTSHIEIPHGSRAFAAPRLAYAVQGLVWDNICKRIFLSASKHSTTTLKTGPHERNSHGLSTLCYHNFSTIKIEYTNMCMLVE